jgi:uncharacterized FAD-dependent dehydrogenase
MNMLGAGHILVQRFGDVLDGKRTWPKELGSSNVVPTLPDAEAGDITAAMPYRAMVRDRGVHEGRRQAWCLALPRTRRCSTRPRSSSTATASRWTPTSTPTLQHLHCLGDSSGWTRGLMMASSVMGLLMGEKLADR